jgi:hypothetical protein
MRPDARLHSALPPASRTHPVHAARVAGARGRGSWRTRAVEAGDGGEVAAPLVSHFPPRRAAQPSPHHHLRPSTSPPGTDSFPLNRTEKSRRIRPSFAHSVAQSDPADAPSRPPCSLSLSRPRLFLTPFSSASSFSRCSARLPASRFSPWLAPLLHAVDLCRGQPPPCSEQFTRHLLAWRLTSEGKKTGLAFLAQQRFHLLEFLLLVRSPIPSPKAFPSL